MFWIFWIIKLNFNINFYYDRIKDGTIEKWRKVTKDHAYYEGLEIYNLFPITGRKKPWYWQDILLPLSKINDYLWLYWKLQLWMLFLLKNVTSGPFSK